MIRAARPIVARTALAASEARVELDCADRAIGGRRPLDAPGGFDAQGLFRVVKCR